ncbi:MAG: MFS transporter [Roseburia sp.]|nr:MFS transporter [Roseburia sp.]MCM1098212.1 MFS transporter [Ruminococcus flavefaciens]
MTMPTLPRYAVEIGMSLSAAGLLTGIFSVMAIFVRPIAGILSDRGGRKPLLILFTLLVSFAAFGYSLSHHFAGLFLCRILHGACFAMSSTIQLAMVTSVIPSAKMGEGMGYMSLAQILAMSSAPSLGLALADAKGYTVMFLVSGILIAAAAVCVVFLPDAKHQTAESVLQAREEGTIPNRRSLRLSELFAAELLLLSAVSGLFSVMNGVASSYLSMLGDERGIVNISIFFTISSVAVLLIRPVAGKLQDKKGLSVVLIPSLILGAAAMFCIGASWSILTIVTAALLKGVAQSSGQAAIQADCARRAPADRRGVAMSTCYLGSDLGNCVGASLGGWLAGLFGYGAMFDLIGVMVVGGLGMYGIQLVIDKKRQGTTCKDAA